MKVSLLLTAAIALLGVSCERHEFEGPEGTKQLHEHHAGAHGDNHDGHPGDGENEGAH